VFQANLTTFLIEPGYEDPIKTVEQMLKSEKYFGLSQWNKRLFYTSTSDTVDSAIVKDAVFCADDKTCLIWAAVYHNISTVIQDLANEYYRASGDWTDGNIRPLLCELEDGFVRSYDFVMTVWKGNPLFELIDDVLGHILEGGIFMHIKERSFDKLKMESKLDVPTFADTYYVISIGHLQTAFYLLILGYVLAVGCFVSELMWHRYRSKVRGTTGTSVCHEQA
jgi:hypothetical protein